MDVQSYQMASFPGAVVAAGTGGSTAPGRVLGEDTASPCPCPGLLFPWDVLPLGLVTCAPPWWDCAH